MLRPDQTEFIKNDWTIKPLHGPNMKIVGSKLILEQNLHGYHPSISEKFDKKFYKDKGSKYQSQLAFDLPNDNYMFDKQNFTMSGVR